VLQGRGRRIIPMLLLAAALLAIPTRAPAAAAPSVSGDGVVGGPLGITSQLGFSASAAGGSFLCVMAGRSGGFPFGPWVHVRQMQVQGRVTPASLEVIGDVARFQGTATIHVVGTTATGAELQVSIPGVGFVSTQGAGGAGVAWHLLEVPSLGAAFGPASVQAGHIGIRA